MVKTLASPMRRVSRGSYQVAISVGSSCNAVPTPWLARLRTRV
jgi:hypothetical protein